MTRRINPHWLAAESPQRRKALEYNLIATVTHLGHNSTSGHYTANVKQKGTDKWLNFDDKDVTSLPLHRVLDDPAYLLVYELSQNF